MHPQHPACVSTTQIDSTIFKTKNNELAIFGQTLDSIRKKLISFNDIWIQGGRFGSKKPQLIYEENLIKELSLDEAGKQLESLSKCVYSGKMTYEQYFNTVGKGNNVLKTYVTTTEQQKQSVQGLVNASKDAREAQLKYSETVKNSTLAAKAQAAALKLTSIALNMAAMLAATKVLEWSVSKIDSLTHSAERCKERVDDLMSSYESSLNTANNNAKTMEGLANRHEGTEYHLRI